MPLYYLGTGTPGGASGTIQYNAAGSFGGITSSSVSGANVSFAGLIALGGFTSSFAALKQEAFATLGVRLADDSTYASINCAGINAYLVSSRTFLAATSVPALAMASDWFLSWASSNVDATQWDLFMTRAAAATLQYGTFDVNGNAVAQTLQVQSAVTGTDKNGGDWTFIGSKQTGAGTPGNIVFKTSVKLASGATQGTPETGLTITGPNATSQHPSVVCGNQALATNASDGFLYACSGAGTPTGTPTTFTGRVPIYIDTTNSQLWLYLGGAWKQPKTPAAAALITWQ